MNQEKICFIGGSCSGKSWIVSQLRNVPYGNNEWLNVDPSVGLRTLGVEVHPVRLGNYIYKVWDCAGERFGGVREGYYTEARKIFIFHGGEENKTPDEWEVLAKKGAPNAIIVHVTGTFEEKKQQVCASLLIH